MLFVAGETGSTCREVDKGTTTWRRRALHCVCMCVRSSASSSSSAPPARHTCGTPSLCALVWPPVVQVLGAWGHPLVCPGSHPHPSPWGGGSSRGQRTWGHRTWLAQGQVLEAVEVAVGEVEAEGLAEVAAGVAEAQEVVLCTQQRPWCVLSQACTCTCTCTCTCECVSRVRKLTMAGFLRDVCLIFTLDPLPPPPPSCSAPSS